MSTTNQPIRLKATEKVGFNIGKKSFDIIGLPRDTVRMYSYKKIKNVALSLVSKRPIDQVRERIRDLHYSLERDENYNYLIHNLISLNFKKHKICHPQKVAKVAAFLSMLTTERQTSSPLHALAAQA
jgi:hypothetical protein